MKLDGKPFSPIPLSQNWVRLKAYLDKLPDDQLISLTAAAKVIERSKDTVQKRIGYELREVKERTAILKSGARVFGNPKAIKELQRLRKKQQENL